MSGCAVSLFIGGRRLLSHFPTLPDASLMIRDPKSDAAPPERCGDGEAPKSPLHTTTGVLGVSEESLVHALQSSTKMYSLTLNRTTFFVNPISLEDGPHVSLCLAIPSSSSRELQVAVLGLMKDIGKVLQREEKRFAFMSQQSDELMRVKEGAESGTSEENARLGIGIRQLLRQLTGAVVVGGEGVLLVASTVSIPFSIPIATRVVQTTRTLQRMHSEHHRKILVSSQFIPPPNAFVSLNPEVSTNFPKLLEHRYSAWLGSGAPMKLSMDTVKGVFASLSAACPPPWTITLLRQRFEEVVSSALKEQNRDPTSTKAQFDTTFFVSQVVEFLCQQGIIVVHRRALFFTACSLSPLTSKPQRLISVRADEDMSPYSKTDNYVSDAPTHLFHTSPREEVDQQSGMPIGAGDIGDPPEGVAHWMETNRENVQLRLANLIASVEDGYSTQYHSCFNILITLLAQAPRRHMEEFQILAFVAQRLQLPTYQAQKLLTAIATSFDDVLISVPYFPVK